MDTDNSTDSNISGEIITPDCTLNKPENIFQRSAEENVFDNPMLLEEIMTYLIFNNDTKISQKFVQTARLVQKSWLKTTTALLHKSVIPFVELNLNENNSLNGAPIVIENGKRLDQFVNRFTCSNRSQHSFLPFKLNLTLEYFREENQQSLINCLSRLQNELIELQISFPIDGGSMPLIFPSLSLPFLKTVSFQFSTKECQHRPGDQDISIFGNNKNGLWLLQLILNATVDLKVLIIPWSTSKDDLVPRNFELLQLPPSITTLALKQTLKIKGVKILLNAHLPNLEHLVIRLQKSPLENGTLFKILDRFRKTLKSFQVGGATVSVNTHPSTFIKFPLMEKLETLRINSTKCELNTENSSNLQMLLPKLKEFWLTYQTETLFEKWIENSKFEAVETISLFIVNDEFRQPDPNYFVSFSLELIGKVHTCFPNVTSLQLTLNVGDIRCLKYLFTNLSQLESLTIDLRGYIGEQTKFYVDSILLGFPVQLVKALRNHSEYFESFQLKQDMEPSILNLSELCTLNISTNEVSGLPDIMRPENDGVALLSDLAFNEGFLKMPKLKNLNLRGKFEVSRNMVQLWTGQGRNIGMNNLDDN